jgi:hypothetical protein
MGIIAIPYLLLQFFFADLFSLDLLGERSVNSQTHMCLCVYSDFDLSIEQLVGAFNGTFPMAFAQ